MGGIGITELLVVLAIALVIFGGRRLPQIGRDLGAGMRGFKDSISGKDQPELPESTDADRTAAERTHAADASDPVVDGEVVRDRR